VPSCPENRLPEPVSCSTSWPSPSSNGLAFVFLNVLAEQAGLPVPAVPTLIIAGALSADATLSGAAVFAAAVVASVIADAAWYVAGLRYGDRVMKFLCRVSLSPDTCVRQTESKFDRWGPGMLVVSKFIPLAGTVARPLAGAMHMRWPTFLFFNTLGTILWVGASMAAGLLLHTQIDTVIARLQDFGAASAMLIAALLVAYVLFKYQQRRRFYRLLRMARITVDELRQQMDQRPPPIVVDVRSRGARQRDGRRIPGALVVDVDEIDHFVRELSPEREIVLYCTCPNEASAARIAKLLIERGFTRVRPLLGGLDAWIDAGFLAEDLPGIIAVREADSAQAGSEEQRKVESI